MTNCPLCGAPGAYAGLRDIECPTRDCANYKAPERLSDDDFKELQRQLENFSGGFVPLW